MATNLRATGTEVIGARLAIPGLLNAHDQRLLVAPNLGWSDLDPLAMLGREWDALGIPTLTRNDADLQSLTAAYQRPGKLLADGAFLYIFGDVGVGGAIMDRGAPIRGAHGWAGEVGHTTVHADGLACKCGSRGCLEAYAGQNALRRAAGLDPDAPIDALTARLSIRARDQGRRGGGRGPGHRHRDRREPPRHPPDRVRHVAGRPAALAHPADHPGAAGARPRPRQQGDRARGVPHHRAPRVHRRGAGGPQHHDRPARRLGRPARARTGPEWRPTRNRLGRPLPGSRFTLYNRT